MDKSSSVSKHIKMHLEHVTAENLRDFRLESFSCMASSNGKHGEAQIGVNGNGKYVVKAFGETFLYGRPEGAIAKYKEILLG